LISSHCNLAIPVHEFPGSSFYGKFLIRHSFIELNLVVFVFILFSITDSTLPVSLALVPQSLLMKSSARWWLILLGLMMEATGELAQTV